MRNIFVLLVLSVLLVNCKKDLETPDPIPPGILPTITTSAVSSITTTSAISGGNVTADGGSPVTERGVCWSTVSNPVVSGSRTIDGSGTGIFTSNLINLTINTTYYLRAYAKNTEGVAYGNQVLFQTNAPLPPGDSASHFFITAASSATGRSFLAYDVSKTKIWEITNFQSTSFWSTPAYDNGKLYVASNNSMLSLNAPTGAINWTYTNPSASVINPKVKNDTLVTAGTLIAPSPNNAVLLINKNTGTVIWNKVVTDQPVITPLLSDGKIFNLTVNGTGTNMIVSAYDVVTRNLIWQTLLTGGFFTAVPPDMIVRNDSLIVFSSNSLVHLLNKNTGTIHWSRTLGTFSVHLYKNDLVFNDAGSGRVTIMSLQTGNIILQSNPINYTMTSNGVSYIYNDAFYNNVSDSVFCTSLIDGSLKWRKKYRPLPGSFKKFIVIGNTVYGSRQFDNANDESKLMILNALDFTAKDSIIVPKRDFSNFSLLSAAGIFY